MILQILAQNYFERKLTFDGIENTCIGLDLQKLATKNGESFKNTCYRLLGYDGCNDPQALMQARVAVLNEDESALEKFNYASLDELAQAVHKTKCKLKKRKPLVVQGMENLDVLVAEYYKTDLQNMIAVGNSLVPFCFWLIDNKSCSVKSILEGKNFEKCLIKFATIECDEPFIYGSTLYTPKTLTAAEQKRINKAALSEAMLKQSPCRSWVTIPLAQLAILSKEKPDVYLDIIDYSIATGQSYADVLKGFGVNVPDLIRVYESTGYAFEMFKDTVLLATDTDAVWDNVPAEIFGSMLQRTTTRNELSLNIPKVTDAIELTQKGECIHALSSF